MILHVGNHITTRDRPKYLHVNVSTANRRRHVESMFQVAGWPGSYIDAGICAYGPAHFMSQPQILDTKHADRGQHYVLG